VDLDRLERNIAQMAAHFKQAGVGWRPHTKGIKVPAIAHMLLAAGAFGVTCAKLGEAEVMAAAGIGDILIANQIVGAQKIARLVNLRPHADVKVAVDNTENVADLGAAAQAKGVVLGVVIEVDTGMQRAGVQPGLATVALARRIDATPGLRFCGLMSWEGHTLTASDAEQKRRGVEQSVGLLVETAELCQKDGLPVEIVSCGGSGTYMITASIPGVTEIQAGGGVFCDMTYQSWGVALEPALFIQSTVTSRPAPSRVILDAGFKTLPRGFATPQPLELNHIQSIVFSAEHGIITLDEPDYALKMGDVIDIVVGYSDATVFLHDTLYGVRNGVVETAWAVQGRGKIR
jgi:D-serine deaminase-like pyridoxal phosphate-dependent protein